ncbi:MAG TPA: hypothetical protein VN873_17190 [Candidatus Angelobacter sp.]|nr:hypothetical protein [Candidatus Angelobacter sp.]
MIENLFAQPGIRSLRTLPQDTLISPGEHSSDFLLKAQFLARQVSSRHRISKTSAMMVNRPAINPEQNGMSRGIVASEEPIPVDLLFLKLLHQVSPNVSNPSAEIILPPVTFLPIAFDLSPEAYRRGAEAGMRLKIAGVLAPLHGDQLMAFQFFPKHLLNVRDRKRIAIQKNQNIVVPIRGEINHVCQKVQFDGMGSDRFRAGIVKSALRDRRHAIQPRVNAVRSF